MSLITSILSILLAWAGGLFLRICIVYLHRKYFRNGLLGDAAAHMSMIRWLRRGYSTHIPQFLIPSKYSYPILFHRCFSLLETEFIKKRPFLPNLIVFAVAYLIFLSATFIYLSTYFPDQALRIFVYSSLLFVFSVSNLNFRIHNILYISLSERLFSRVCTSFAFLFILMTLQYYSTTAITLSIFFVSVALLSSKFARQVLVFTLPLLSIALVNAIPSIILILGFALSFALGRARFLESFLEGFKYAFFTYRKFIKNTFRSKTVLSSFVSLTTLWSFIIRREIRPAIRELIEKEPVRTILNLSEIWFMIVLLLFGSSPDDYFTRILLVVLGIYLLTGSRYFNHLGESYRYLEYSLYFVFPISLAVMLNQVAEPLYLLAVFMSYGLVSLILSLRHQNKTSGVDLVSNFINSFRITESDRIIAIPAQLGRELSIFNDAKYLLQQFGGITSQQVYTEYYEQYPYPTILLGPLIDKHGITKIIVNKKSVSNLPFSYKFEEYHKEFEDDVFEVYSTGRR